MSLLPLPWVGRWLAVLWIAVAAPTIIAAEPIEVPLHHVTELVFNGPERGPADTPARDVILGVTLRHESDEAEHRVLAFWDGDGRGGATGGVWKVRFCPTRTGRWKIGEVASNVAELATARADVVICTESKHPGFWIADGRWYRRSDGSYPFITGNTHYSFLSGQNDRGKVKTDPVADIRANARHFKKLRFTPFGDRYPNPQLKPFFDERGEPTDDGRHSCRPNPQWFSERVDPVIRAGFDADLICDLILCGPDTRDSRSALQGDPTPWLRYVAARYGSYPHVWFCLANEWNIKEPKYSADEIRAAGKTLRGHLDYGTPVSVHANTGDWTTDLNGDWHDHVIIQHKLKRLGKAADAATRSYQRGGGKPVVNDENAYQGQGDRFSYEDTVEGCLGTFLGGGYPTTGEKYGNKLGQYFWGGFDAEAHTAAKSLGALRAYVDREIQLGSLAPLPLAKSPFHGARDGFRVLENPAREYVLGSNAAATIAVELPPGEWSVKQLDLLATKVSAVVLMERVSGRFEFGTPESRAALTHLKRIDSE